MGRRLARWAVVAVLAAGCTAPSPQTGRPTPAAGDHTDVWFMQHVIPHLWQATTIAFLSRDRLNHPVLARLAGTIDRRGQADIQRLQGWLSARGLAPHGHSHQGVDNRRATDLERLSRLRGTALDLAFLEVMAARDHAGARLATIEATQGTLPEVRQLARQMLIERRQRAHQMHAWKQAWSKALRPGTRSCGSPDRIRTGATP